MHKLLTLGLLSLLPSVGWATEKSATVQWLDLTHSWVGFVALIIFFVAYFLVMMEEKTDLRKSKPVLFGAGLIWVLIGGIYAANGFDHAAEQAVRHNILEYAELMLFLLVAMTYIKALEERLVFEALRSWLTRKGFGFRTLFIITGTLAFFISPVADNLTTALLMCAVVMAVGVTNQRFVVIALINIVVAANAGGAFSPFGDITTLMVWQKGLVTDQGTVGFWQFFHLFLPSLVNWLVPASIMLVAVPNKKPEGNGKEVRMRRGAKRIMLLFLATIATAVSFHQFLHIPPVLGMLFGLSYLGLFGFYLKKTVHKCQEHECAVDEVARDENMGSVIPFDLFTKVEKAEWDTLFFFGGVILCVGGLGFIGYLAMVPELLYVDMGPTTANVMVGLLSAIVDNIPVIFAVLTMEPDMSMGQWLLVTLTAGVGGSLLSIGSAAGVALMGQARGAYTFWRHLIWTPVIALGYVSSILVHFWVNSWAF